MDGYPKYLVCTRSNSGTVLHGCRPTGSRKKKKEGLERDLGGYYPRNRQSWYTAHRYDIHLAPAVCCLLDINYTGAYSSSLRLSRTTYKRQPPSQAETGGHDPCNLPKMHLID